MRRITEVSELREIQMSIMDCIHTYCVNNNLTYSLSSGTLIGAIRHKGYIPWDDDIDIYMPRDSYNQFVRDFGIQDGHYELINYKNRNPYPQTFAKVIDNETIAEEKDVPIPELGVWVDVFPVDGMPKNKYARKLLILSKRFVSMLIQCGIPKEGSHSFKYYFCRYFPLPRNARFKLFEWMITRYRSSQIICNMSSGGPPTDKSFSKSCIDNYIEVPFENRSWLAMSGWDTYLKTTYGDYMKLPPVEMQQHHDYVAYYK